ncbi:MAG: hypothetical protein IMZ44_11750 [Planctomycetes bacterium]|nr:hypothetical protein [Planctomycetota bacterium]
MTEIPVPTLNGAFDIRTAAGQMPTAIGVFLGAADSDDSDDSQDADTLDILAAAEPIPADVPPLLVVGEPASATAIRI